MDNHQLQYLLYCHLFVFSLVFFFKIFIYLLLDGKGGRKRGRETSVYERYIDQLPLTRPQMGTWPIT